MYVNQDESQDSVTEDIETKDKNLEFMNYDANKNYEY